MAVYALRTDKAFAEVKAWVEGKQLTGFSVREVSGENEHWHWLLEDSNQSRTIQQLRMDLKRKVSVLSGNGAYSLTVCRDVEKYERYLCKGESEGAGPEVAWAFSLKYSDARIGELHEEYWQANRALKRRRVGGMIDWVIDECKRQNVEWSNRRRISEIYIRELGACSKPINLFSIRSNVNAVQFALCPNDECLTSLVDRCEQY